MRVDAQVPARILDSTEARRDRERGERRMKKFLLDFVVERRCGRIQGERASFFLRLAIHFSLLTSFSVSSTEKQR